jgi:hypothetical protein
MMITPSTADSNSTPSAKPVPEGYQVEDSRLEDRFQRTYFTLRWGVAILGATLPPLLVVVAWLRGGVGLQASMSTYYFAGNGAARDVFVGVLVAVGAGLFFYRGFSRAEDLALNFAGAFAVAVAIVPTQWQCGASCSWWSVHGTAAVLFFVCIAYVSLVRAADTLVLLRDDKTIKKYKAWYYGTGLVMIGSPLAAVIASAVFQRRGSESPTLFFIEAFGVESFAAYWIAKSIELRETSAAERAAAGGLKRATRHRRMWFDDAIVVPK